MEDDDQHGDEELAAEPPTERVRIVGAEPAAVLAGDQSHPEQGFEGPVEREQHYLGFVHQAPAPPPPLPPPPEDTDALAAVSPELPHWADPPTGQVPAIIDSRADADEDEWATIDSGPVWREHEHEWEDSGGYEPSMLADDETRVGALDETPLEERRPWEFDDEDSLTAEHPVVGGETATEDASAAAPSWWDAEQAESRAPDPAETTLTAEPPTRAFPAPSPAATAHVSAPVAPRPQRPPARRTRRTAPPASDDEGGKRNVPVAVATGVGLAAVALLCFSAGPLVTLVLATIVVTLAVAEAYASLRRAGMRPASLLGLVATVAVMVSAYSKGVAALPLVTILVVLTSMLWYLVGAERVSPVEGITSTVLSFAWIGLTGSFAALMLAPSIYPHRHGVAFLLGAVVATVGADVGALAVGSWMGRHQLAPHVSPNKTWEGWVGGAVLAVALSVAVTGRVHPWTAGKAAILGVVIAVVAPLGDLCESLVKRDLGLKDMGSLLPGHGGVLDRVDGLLFALPATYYLVRILNLG